MKYIINTDALYGGDIYKSMLLMGTNGRGEVIVQKFNLDELEELNGDYINEHFGSLQDEAYHRGLEEGKKATYGLVADASSAEYQRGLNDAWEAARNISMLESDGGYSWKEMKSIFGTDNASEIYKRHTASEVISKIKAYEEKQKAENEIKVGDEVRWGMDLIVVKRVRKP